MQTPEGTTATETTATQQPAPVVPQAAAAAPEPKDEHNPPWLAARLERERKALLNGLGVQSEADAKTALAAYKQAQEAAKSEAQRTAEKLAALEAQAASLTAANAQQQAVIAARAALELAALTDAQRAAVAAIAGEDVGKQLLAIDHLKPTWAAAPATPAPSKPAIPAPANTSPQALPGAGAVPGAPADHLADWKSLTAKGQHVHAAALLAVHPEIATGLYQ